MTEVIANQGEVRREKMLRRQNPLWIDTEASALLWRLARQRTGLVLSTCVANSLVQIVRSAVKTKRGFYGEVNNILVKEYKDCALVIHIFFQKYNKVSELLKVKLLNV
jgi:hypothetical protein